MKTQLANAYMRSFNGTYTVFVKGIDEATLTVVSSKDKNYAVKCLEETERLVQDYNTNIISTHSSYSRIQRLGEGGHRL